MSERIVAGSARRAMRRMLTAKNSPKDYYKGTGSGCIGKFTMYGKFVVDPGRIRDWIVPSGLDNFPLKPYVSHLTKRVKETPLTVDAFLQDISMENNSTSNEQTSASIIPKEVLDRPPIRIPNIVKKITEVFMQEMPKSTPNSANTPRVDK